jgi:predicted Zn-dependent protease
MILTNYYSCAQEDEETAFQKASDLKDAAARVTALEKFTRNFPESDKLRTVHLRLFEDYLELNNVDAALTSGSAYLSYFPEENRMRHYNRLAWSLAQKGVGLDSAKVYAMRAVQLARDINYRYLFIYLDTYALTIFKQGNAAQAEEVQNEAIKGNENDSDLLSHLAMYQHANGKQLTALKTMAKSLLLGSESQGIDDFQKWLEEEAPQELQRINLTKSIVYETINENLRDDASPLQRSQAAALLARCDIDLERAEQWAAQAIANVNENTSRYDKVQIYTNLAQIYKAQKKYSKMLEILKGFESTAMPYDFEFWSILAQAYEQNGQTEKAIDAYVNGSLLRKDDKVFAALNTLGLSNDQIDLYIEQTKEEIINFDPGHYNVKAQNTKRVVLTELFTGSECAPCVGADLALDKIAEYYPRSIMALLEYHVHIPRPDALTNNSSEERYQYYAQHVSGV